LRHFRLPEGTGEDISFRNFLAPSSFLVAMALA
jgi:hypothetical protein